MTTVYIHAGIHKTGSTALQALFNKSREQLQAAGIHYLEPTPGTGNHRACADALTEKLNKGVIPPVWERALAEIRGSDCGISVISSENFDRLDMGGVERLAAVLDQAEGVDAIHVVIYIRPQACLLSSQYNQQVKEGFRWDDFDSFLDTALAARPRWVSFPDLLKPWRTHFGANLSVRIAEPEWLIGASVPEDFLELLGQRSLFSRLRGNDRRNPSLSPDALEGIRDVLKDDGLRQLDFPERRRLLRGFVNERLWEPYVAGTGNADVFGGGGASRATLTYCRHLFRDDNRWLADKFFGGTNHVDDCYGSLIAGASKAPETSPNPDSNGAGTRERVRKELLGYWRRCASGEAPN